MPLNLPTSPETVKQRVKTDIQANLPLSNPFVKGSWLRAMSESFGERMYDFYYGITRAINEIYPDTTTDNLDRWGSIYNTSRIGSTVSEGFINFAGSAFSSPVTPGAIFTDDDGNEYEAISTASVGFNVLPTTLNRSGTTLTVTTASPHYAVTGVEITLSLSSTANYNGTFVPTVTGANTFTVQLAAATGSTTSSGITNRVGNIVQVRSLLPGEDKNLDPFTSVTLSSSISGIESTSMVYVDGLSGGSDTESDTDYRNRVLDLIRNPISHFNVSDVTRIAKTISGINRVSIAESSPNAGQVTIYPLTNDPVNPIPDASTITAVKSKILTIKPANTSDVDVRVLAAAAVTVNFTFTVLSPDTVTMRNSIEENLKQFFATKVERGSTIYADAYRSAIFQTVDTTTGESVNNFTLSAPTGNVTILSSQIGVLGTITWP